ncbi:MAG: hypothetical protein M0Z58_08745 [Nitrospiraceae bacterium]|nr:hypothetical protein [Nitrospiraceae bacterium]
MMLLDSADGVIMLFAYKWAYINPLRKMRYNLTITGLSVFLSLGIGVIEALQVIALELRFKNGVRGFLTHLSFSETGGVIALISIALWGGYFPISRLRQAPELNRDAGLK